MKKLFFVFSLIFSFVAIGQVHNRMLKFNVGYSPEQVVMKKLITKFNDTSSLDKMNLKMVLPVISIGEDFAVNSRLSISATLGYQYFDLNYNNKNIGTHLFFISANPQLSLFYRPGFEYYMKLKVGGIYRSGKRTDLPNAINEFLPAEFGFFTGLTIAGVNVFVHDNWGINAEFSIWSPERVNVGLTYRFFKGEIPEGVPLDEYYMD